GSGKKYTIMASTGTGTGTLALKLVDNDSIVDGSQHPLGGKGTSGNHDGSQVGETYTIDRTSPRVASFSRYSPMRRETNFDELIFRVAFNEPVLNVDLKDFILDSVSNAQIVSVREHPNSSG